MSDETENKNVFLEFFRLDLLNKMIMGKDVSGERIVYDPPCESTDQSLLVGFFDSSRRDTSTVLTTTEYKPAFVRTYARIMDRLDKLNDLFMNPETGYVKYPHRYDEVAKSGNFEAIESIGELLFGIISKLLPQFGYWAESLINTFQNREKHDIALKTDIHLTIISNDFNIPWFWIKPQGTNLFLNQVCAIGVLQLDCAGKPIENDEFNHSDGCRTNRSLLIRGNSSLPLIDVELEAIKDILSNPEERTVKKYDPIDTQLCSNDEQISNLHKKYSNHDEIEESFKIFHYNGHFSGRKKGLLMDNEDIPFTWVNKYLENALLVLDGCNSSEGLDAWDNMDSLTSVMLKKYHVLGCIVTVLPIKHDPVSGKIFWTGFYRAIRQCKTVGQALQIARWELWKYYQCFNSDNPSWLFYQLIGRPNIRVFSDQSSNLK